MFTKLTIVAPGLLGASIAMAARHKGLAETISVFARRQEAVDNLLQSSWCDSATTDLGAACRGADFIVLCAPVERIISIARSMAPLLDGQPVVTDVGSVKGEIVRQCQAALEGKARFVGAHPMAGSEKTGMENATADLFQERVCFVTPHTNTDARALRSTLEFWQSLGADVIQQSPDIHDEIVAKVSHLPHLLASSLAAFLGASCPDASAYCGNGLKDTVRIASGDPALWGEIISQNRPEILQAIDAFQDHLHHFRSAIANENNLEILKQLADGKQFRDNL